MTFPSKRLSSVTPGVQQCPSRQMDHKNYCSSINAGDFLPAACDFLPHVIPSQTCNSVALVVLLANVISLQTCNFPAACSFPANLHWSWLSSFCPHLSFVLPTRPPAATRQTYAMTYRLIMTYELLQAANKKFRGSLRLQVITKCYSKIINYSLLSKPRVIY